MKIMIKSKHHLIHFLKLLKQIKQQKFGENVRNLQFE